MLLQKGAALTLSHTAPHAELDAVVERIGTALGHDGTMPANNSGLPLSGTPDEQFVGIGLSAQRFGYPCDPGFAIRTLEQAVKRCCDCPARSWPIT